MLDGILRVALALGVLVAAGASAAHPLAPALLELTERGPGDVQVRWKTSLYRARTNEGAPLAPSLPAHCLQTSDGALRVVDTALVETWTVDCGSAGLVGATVGVDGLDRAGIDALVRVALRDGRTLNRVLRAAAPRVVVPARPARVDVARSYARLGVEHILSGPDHLLFVVGLFLLVPERRRLVVTLTAFTLGHSVTLSLAVLGWVAFPTRPIELLIAGSVLWLAVELTQRGRAALHAVGAPVLAAGFGLLHGLGFAGALAETGLPAGEIPLALLAFNVGIEVGQVFFVVALLGLRSAVGRMAPGVPRLARPVAVYTMGAFAASWCIERGLALLE